MEKTLPFWIPPFAYTLLKFHLTPHYFISPCFRSFSTTPPSHFRASTITVAPSSLSLLGTQLIFLSTNHPFLINVTKLTLIFLCSFHILAFFGVLSRWSSFAFSPSPSYISTWVNQVITSSLMINWLMMLHGMCVLFYHWLVQSAWPKLYLYFICVCLF